jgi:hypothetical protein
MTVYKHLATLAGLANFSPATGSLVRGNASNSTTWMLHLYQNLQEEVCIGRYSFATPSFPPVIDRKRPVKAAARESWGVLANTGPHK